jgi:glycogen synthase
LWEPFGLVALEGMVYQKLILTSNRGGLKEVLSGYKKQVDISEKNIVEQLHDKRNAQTDFNHEKYEWHSISRKYLAALEAAQVKKVYKEEII